MPRLENPTAHWLGLSGLCFGLVRLSASRYGLERLPVNIKSVKTVNKEIVGFLLVYLLPLINKSQKKYL
ncbi:MAG: hypothetical protein V7751_06305 [Pseudoalteromonas distincta]